MKIALWIHCLMHLVLAATLVFYFDKLHRHLLHLAGGKIYLPAATHIAIYCKSFLWLMPVACVAATVRLSRGSLTPDSHAVFNACSILVIVCSLAFAVLATCAPFMHPPLLAAP